MKRPVAPIRFKDGCVRMPVRLLWHGISDGLNGILLEMNGRKDSKFMHEKIHWAKVYVETENFGH